MEKAVEGQPCHYCMQSQNKSIRSGGLTCKGVGGGREGGSGQYIPILFRFAKNSPYQCSSTYHGLGQIGK